MARYLGLGTTLGVDDDDSGTVFTAITLPINATPPPRERELVDATALADTLATYEPGIETHSAYSYTHYYEANETNGNLVTTLFANKTKVLWQITYTSTDIEQFEGFVSNVGPAQIVTNELYKREVTIQRTGAIAYS